MIKTDDTKADCIIWPGAKRHNGYGFFKRKGRNLAAHRVAWEKAYCRPIPDGLCVLHKCDNPPCVNPDHLFLGTVVDNNADRKAKGRYNGERNGRAKLTAEDVVKIRILCSTGGMTDLEIGNLYGVADSTIRHIRKKRNWRHIQ